MCLTKILYKVLPVEFQPQLHPPSAAEGLRAGLSAETGLSAAGMDPVQETERLEMYSKQANKQTNNLIIIVVVAGTGSRMSHRGCASRKGIVILSYMFH